MSANALAICWAPTLIGHTSTSGVGTFFVQECIEWAEFLFPDDSYPKLENQTLDFNFSKRASELMEKQKKNNENISDDYGFIGREVVSNNEQQAQSVLNQIKPQKRKKAAPGVPNAVPLNATADPPRVQILHSSTPNLSARNVMTVTPVPAKPAATPVVPQTPPIQQAAPRTPKRAARQTDYTGFGLMTDSDGEDSNSNLSLTEELSSHLDNVLLNEGVNSMGVDSQPTRPAKPPPPKPKPPGNILGNIFYLNS